MDGLLTVEENLLSPPGWPGSADGPRGRRWPAAHRADRARDRAPDTPARRALRRLAPAARHRPGHSAPARSPHSRRADRRTRPGAPRAGVVAARGPAPRATAPPILFSTHYLAEAEPADRVVLLVERPGRGRRRACGAPGDGRATRSRRSRARAPSVWLGRSAGSAPRRIVRPDRARLPGRARRGSARRWSSWPARRPASSASRSARRRWRTSTSRETQRRRRRRMSSLERRVRHRGARPDAHHPADRPAAGWGGAAVHVAAAGGHRLQRHRPARGRPLLSGVRLPRHRGDGGAVRRRCSPPSRRSTTGSSACCG